MYLYEQELTMGEQSSNGLWGQLKKRKVVRVALVYIFVSWIIIQLGEASFEALQIPMWGMSLLLVLVGLGFPLALILAWAHESGSGNYKQANRQIDSLAEFEGFGDEAPSIEIGRAHV